MNLFLGLEKRKEALVMIIYHHLFFFFEPNTMPGGQIKVDSIWERR